jgi:hypothetical protein
MTRLSQSRSRSRSRSQSRPEPLSYDGLTRQQLHDLANSRGIPHRALRRKDDLIRRIQQYDGVNPYNVLPPPGLPEEPSQPTIDVITLLTHNQPPDPSIIAHARIPTSLADQLIQQPQLQLQRQVVDQVRDELQHMTVEELRRDFVEWGFPTTNLRRKQDYIDRFFEFVATMLPEESPQEERNILMPPLH